MCDVTHLYVWCDPFVCVTWLICMCDMTHLYVWHDPFVCVMWLICMCDVTHLYVWRDSFVCVTWPICMCYVTHSYVWYGPFVRVTWPICMCDVIHLYVWRDPFVCVMWSICMCDVTHGCLSFPTTSRHPLCPSVVWWSEYPPPIATRSFVNPHAWSSVRHMSLSHMSVSHIFVRHISVSVWHISVRHISVWHISVCLSDICCGCPDMRQASLRDVRTPKTYIQDIYLYVYWLGAWCPDLPLGDYLVSFIVLIRVCHTYETDIQMCTYIHTYMHIHTFIHTYIHLQANRYLDQCMSHIWVRRWHLNESVTWIICMCDMTHWYVWHDSFICVTWLKHIFSRAFGRLCCMPRQTLRCVTPH